MGELSGLRAVFKIEKGNRDKCNASKELKFFTCRSKVIWVEKRSRCTRHCLKLCACLPDILVMLQVGSRM